MTVIEKLSIGIGKKITLILEKDEEFEEVMIYGAINFFQTIYAILAVIVVGFICGVTYEALIISFVMALLRKYSGGVHASTPNKCAIFGAVSSSGLALIAKYLIVKSLGFILIFGVMVFMFLYYVVYYFAPVDSEEKPINNEEMRKRLKKGSLAVINFFFLLTIVSFFYIYYKNSEYIYLLIYCCFMGLIFQGFSLTKTGNEFLLIVDNFF
ncbi:MAG: accessory gene regulator ArgB-like protein [Clostridiaceae bacterium]